MVCLLLENTPRGVFSRSRQTTAPGRIFRAHVKVKKRHFQKYAQGLIYEKLRYILCEEMDSINEIEPMPVLVFGLIFSFVLFLVWKSVSKERKSEYDYELLTKPRDTRRISWRDEFHER